ncbi:MAG: NAD-dependent epimerase/dehydratase family protein [Planctomycetales bacterium]|nr:NAD-dependent epimerase/dehydratase family protein [Planctomycetales bacterium]
MALFSGKTIKSGTIVRMLADVVLLQIAMISGLALRFIYSVVFELNLPGARTYQKQFELYQEWYLWSSVPLTATCLIMFTAVGFYSRGRYYQNRYKVLVVVQAITAAYIVYGFGMLFFGSDLQFSKIALALAWALSIALLAGARVWTAIWRRTDHAALSPGDSNSVLVIGGGGYIGSALIPKLLDAGMTVRVLDMLLFGEEPLAEVIGHERLEIIKGDFRRPDKVVEAMRGVGSVIHLGAIVGDPACALDETLTIDVNLMATLSIAGLAKSHGVKRFVFASTCSVYGAVDEILDERSEVLPVSLYGHTKLASEKMLTDMTSSDFKPTILRFGTIYGLSGRTRFDLVVNLLTAKAKIDGIITIQDGDQWRPFVHVEDAAEAVSTVLQAPVEVVGGEIFNVGSNEQNTTIRGVGELIHQLVPTAELTESETGNDRRNYRVDFSKIRNLVDFRPKWTLETGIKQVLEAIASGKVKNYKDAQYSNVAFLTREGTDSLANDRWARELIENLQTVQAKSGDDPQHSLPVAE